MSHIFALEALDMSIHLLLILGLAHHLGILIRSWMPCSCFTTSSCLLLLHPQITTLMVDLDLNLGFNFWLNLRLLGWAILGKMSHIMALVAHEMRYLFFLHLHVLALSLFEANATLVTIASLILHHMLKSDFGVVAPL